MQSLEQQNEVLQHLVGMKNDGRDPAELPSRLNQVYADDGQRAFGSTVLEYLLPRAEPPPSHPPTETFEHGVHGAVYKLQAVPQVDTGFELSPNRRARLQQALLTKLHYPEMDYRVETVAEAHKSTFRWIFEERQADHGDRSTPHFRQWLESGNQLYWITGKAGSGKSTLMKYICQVPSPEGMCDMDRVTVEHRCTQYLRQWARGQRLAVASFYFWAAGTKMQTSKEGLYRTLLYQILTCYPDIIDTVFPRRWDCLCLFNEDPLPFHPLELMKGLAQAVSLLTTERETKLCLFIDGLDEFDGDHDELIRLLADMTRSCGGEHLKLCLASRPWIVFEEAFRNKPSLRLEDLTFNDIKDYVSSRFRAEGNFSSLSQTELDFVNRLTEQVVRKATGVFLWANLVVTSLLDGLKSGDRVSDLQRRLDRLPPDLEDLYKRILDTLDPHYVEHAVQYFTLMLACREPPPVLFFSLADEDDVEFSLHLSEDVPLTNADLDLRIDSMQRRLNSRCRGLLEIARGLPSSGYDSAEDATTHLCFGSTVQYLHRTVKDYMETPAVRGHLQAKLHGSFDPHIRLCSASLGMFKIEARLNGAVSVASEPSTLATHLLHSMRHAGRVSAVNVPIMLRVVGQFETLYHNLGLGIDALPQDIDSCINPSDSTTGSPTSRNQDNRLSNFESSADSFLYLVIKCQVLEYLKAQVTGPVKRQRDWRMESALNKSLSLNNRRSRWGTALGNLRVNVSSKPKIDEVKYRIFISMLLSYAIPAASPHIPTITYLLQNGADVNLKTVEGDYGTLLDKKLTIWERTLATLILVFSEGFCSPRTRETWLDATTLLLRNGAKVNQNIVATAFELVCKKMVVAGSLPVDNAKELLLQALRRCAANRSGLELDFLSGLTIVKKDDDEVPPFYEPYTTDLMLPWDAGLGLEGGVDSGT